MDTGHGRGLIEDNMMFTYNVKTRDRSPKLLEIKETEGVVVFEFRASVGDLGVVPQSSY